MKYIVDCPEGHIPYKATNERCLIFPGDPSFEIFDESKIRIAMGKNAIEQLRNEGRKQAWAVAQKILKDTKRGGYKPSELLEIFDCASTYKCIVDNSIEEAIRKIKDWEDTFHVGDIVVLRDVNPVRGVVTNIEKYADGDEPCYGVLFEDGTYGSFCSDDLEKTKEHVDLSDIFAKLKGEK